MAPAEACASRLHLTQSLGVAADLAKCTPYGYCCENSLIINTKMYSISKFSHQNNQNLGRSLEEGRVSQNLQIETVNYK